MEMGDPRFAAYDYKNSQSARGNPGHKTRLILGKGGMELFPFWGML
jgi:hypothetical protein